MNRCEICEKILAAGICVCLAGEFFHVRKHEEVILPTQDDHHREFPTEPQGVRTIAISTATSSVAISSGFVYKIVESK